MAGLRAAIASPAQSRVCRLGFPCCDRRSLAARIVRLIGVVVGAVRLHPESRMELHQRAERN